MDTLVVDVQLMPLGFVPWQDAVTMTYKDRARVLEIDRDGRKLHAPNFEMDMPRVIQVKNHIARKMRRKVPLNRRNLLTRDDHRCQYCGRGIDTHEYTQD